MSYTPDILIKKDELDKALLKIRPIKKYNEMVYNDTEDDFVGVLKLNDFNVFAIFACKVIDSDRVNKVNIEGKDYYWLYAEVSRQVYALMDFCKKKKITYIVSY